jgi:hypothetical protein
MNTTVYGPYLRFQDYTPVTEAWWGSVLVLVHKSMGVRPKLHLHDGGSNRTIPASCLDSFQDWDFWRCDLGVTLGAVERQLVYWLDLGAGLSAILSKLRTAFRLMRACYATGGLKKSYWQCTAEFIGVETDAATAGDNHGG